MSERKDHGCTMKIIEYRPSDKPGQRKQPDHLSDRPSFNSRGLGRIVSTAGVLHLLPEDLDDLYQELTQEIQALALRKNSQKWPLSDYRRMKAKLASWGAVHQAIITRRAAINKVEKRRRHLEGYSVADCFMDIAHEELPKELFCQLLEGAKQRHGQFQLELSKMIDP
jgi:hypothetical protein